MDAKPFAIGKILSERQRFVVPIYQRTYSWTVKKQLAAFFQQIETKASELLADGRTKFSHYMGALLVIPDGDPVFGRIQVFNVVDGQQRLTTFHLLYAALRDIAREKGFADIYALITDLLVHGDNVPMQDKTKERYKLEPTRYDKDLFHDLIDLDGEALQKKYAEHFYKNGNIKSDDLLPLKAYWFFRDRATGFITDEIEEQPLPEQEKRLRALSTALFEDFRLIVITLAKDDDAQVIFETLNSGGEPLAAMDLVRNDLFHRATGRGENVEALMDNQWSVFEDSFWKQIQTQGRIKKPRIDFFLAHTLAAEQGKLISLSELYTEYKEFVADRNLHDTAEELAILTAHAETYKSLVNPPAEGAMARLAKRLDVFDVSTAYPLIFVIAKSDASDDEKERLYDLVASYVIRRAICGLTPKNYNNVFIEIASSLDLAGVSVDTFSMAFALKKGDTTKFPSDADLVSAIRTREIYRYLSQNRLRLILTELEFAMRDKYSVDGSLQDGLSIEHVMPQKWAGKWALPSGRFAPADFLAGTDEAMLTEIDNRQRLIHTLGNLTLLTPPGNSSGGNAPFPDKLKRLNESLLRMNTLIASEPVWDEATIIRRANVIAEAAKKLWPAPTASSD